MRIQSSNSSIAEIRDAFERKDLVVNKTYQRSADVWPATAKSYFIDTILTQFPFPKVYFHENIDRKTKKIRREIVDGQQRITTIISFLNDEFAVSSISKEYKGKTFSDLDEDEQLAFLSYSIPIDMIISANQDEILEMFRRMNSFTSPLNKAELRHSSYQGEFKWTINEFTDKYSPLLIDYKIITQKQSIRMNDADLITELFQIIVTGIVNRADSSLLKLYKDNDSTFPKKMECIDRLTSCLDFIKQNLSAISGTFLCKSYVFYSLVAALIHNKYGDVIVHSTTQNPAPNLPTPTGHFCSDLPKTLEQLATLSDAHETQDTTGKYGEYVNACLQTTHRITQRATRTKYLMEALNCQL